MKKRIARIILLVQALVCALLRGGSKRNISAPKRLVVFQLAKLGDMVCTTPMFRAIKKTYPEAELTVVGDRINKQLLEHHPDVDHYIVWDKDDLSLVLRELKKSNFDFACLTGPNFEGLSLLILAGIPLVVAPEVVNGWSPYETRPYRLLRKFAIVKPHAMGSYAPREYLRLLEAIGLEDNDTKKYLAHSSEATENVKKYFRSQGVQEGDFLVGISASAGNKVKEWPEERFAQVADHLFHRYGARVMVIGGPKDGGMVEKVLSGVTPEAKALGVTHWSIDELKAAVSQLSLFIAVDTGPIYIAEAYGVPTIDIVGPMDENEQPPRSPKNKVVVPKNRSKPELHIMNARAYDEARALEQVLSISAEEVIEATDDLIDIINK